jgi:hypothetical protein
MLSQGARLTCRGRAGTLDRARSTGKANRGEALAIPQGAGKGARRAGLRRRWAVQNTDFNQNLDFFPAVQI